MTRHRLVTRTLAALAVPLLIAACSSGGGVAALPTIPPATPTPSGGIESAEPTHPGPTFPPDCPREQPEAMGADETATVTIETDKGSFDIKVEGAWKRLRDEMRGFHWMTCYGDYLRETGYALGKVGVKWENASA